MTSGPAHAPASRRLIVNADDFGQSEGINDGIIQCYCSGIVSSASLMVRWPWAGAAADHARRAPTLSVGLHLDLGEWVYTEGDWLPTYLVANPSDGAAVRGEITRQLDAFRRLVRREPTHIDSHQHVHLREPVRSIVMELADRLAVPLRGASADVAYRGGFYGQTEKGDDNRAAISVDGLIDILATLPIGTSELGCHPGVGQDAPGMYVAERQQEVVALCHPRARATLEAQGIRLISFHDLSCPVTQPSSN